MRSHSTAPVFVLGTNRSGTTLLRLLLNAHSQIAIPEEMNYFQSSSATTSIENWRRPNLSEATYSRLVSTFLSRVNRFLDLADIDTVRANLLRNGPQDFREPYRAVMQAVAAAQGKPRWGEKTPGNLFYVDVLYEMFPDARFVYLVRDPRAGVASMLNTDFFPSDVVFNALSRAHHDAVARRLLQTHVPPAQWTTIRYEDLVRTPEQTLRSICTMIQVDFEPSMLTFYETAEDHMKRDAYACFNAAARRPISTARIHKWRTQLSARDVALVERICRSEFSNYGYERTNEQLPLEAQMEWMAKLVYWQYQMWRHRKNRHYTVKHEMFARLRHRTEQLSSHHPVVSQEV